MSENEKTEEKEKCPHCGGRGYIRIEEDDPAYEKLKEQYGNNAWCYFTEKRCICTKREKFKEKVGPDIYNAEKLEESLLWDKTNEDLFISSTWKNFRPHLRHVLARKKLNYFWEKTADTILRDIYMGNSEKWSSLSSCVKRPKLLIVQLNVLSYKNKAMSGIIQETLRIRENESLSTWILNPPHEPFQDGHLAWSASLESYLQNHFKKLSIKSKEERSEEEDGEMVDAKNTEDAANLDSMM